MAKPVKGCAAFGVAAALLFAANAPVLAEPSDSAPMTVAEAVQPPGKPLILVKPSTSKKVAKSHSRVKLTSRGRSAMHVATAKVSAKRAVSKAEVTADNDGATLPSKAMPPDIADARAQMAPAAPATPMEIAAADQINELDRALAEAPPKAQETERPALELNATSPATLETAPGAAVAAAPPPSVTQASSTSPSGESTLLGKIFIAFGGLLTLASAARMLIA